MSHALANVVHAERFLVYLGDHDLIEVGCPQCPSWGIDLHDLADASVGYERAATFGALLAAARAHIAEAHTAAAPDELAAVLHAVDAVQGDAYPALIPEAQLATRPVKVCGFTGNTIRGPLYPVEEPGAERVWMCRICFGRYRRSVAHVPSPLPIEGEAG